MVMEERSTAEKIPVGVHTSVLLKEIIDGLAVEEGDIVVDATVNGGGMSEEVLNRFGGKIQLVSIDADSSALEKAKEKLGERKEVTLLNGNFRNLKELLQGIGVLKIDRIMFDLGLSSNQLENSERGFSFKKDEPLLMTFEKAPGENTLTASDIANTWDTENIEIILRAYGEERQARRIAEAIVEARKIKKIETAKELGEIIERVIRRRGKIHPATKTFQAFRMAVNDELETLKIGLRDGFELLRGGGHMAVISFHSLEDRVVKNFMREKAKEGEGTLITKKPIVPGRVEQVANPRSRSAKLRIIKK